MRLGEVNVNILLFANDMVLVADSEESLWVNLTKLDEVLTKWEMKMNWEKTEVMKVGKERLVRRVYESEMEGRRGRGRPRKKWKDNFK